MLYEDTAAFRGFKAGLKILKQYKNRMGIEGSLAVTVVFEKISDEHLKLLKKLGWKYDAPFDRWTIDVPEKLNAR